MKAFTSILALASAVNAHMIMRTPVPAGSPNSSPLSGDGSDFPCKIPGGSGTIDETNLNQMSVGSSNTLSFTGSAVHGGGSCQISVAKGLTVDKNTKWMVIHSIEGGCPAAVAGNLPADPNGTGASTFQFTFPDHPDLGPGKYTLAWTWNNKIGNREFYMNCAAVQVSGAAKKRYMPSSMAASKRQSSSLPSMFVANIGNGCSTAEGIDVRYPDPGSSLETGSAATFGDPTGSCGVSRSGSGPGSGTGTGSGSGSGSGASSAVYSNTVQPVRPSGTGFAGGSGGAGGAGASGFPGGPGGSGGQLTQSQGGSFATVSPVAGGGQSSVATPSAPVPTASAPAASSPAASDPVAPPTVPSVSSAAPAVPVPSSNAGSGSSSGSSSSTGSYAVGQPCSDEGYWACAADGKSFQRCASLSWSASIPMSAGLTCTPGTSANFSYNVSGSGGKRDLKSHISRRRSNHHGSFLS